MGGGDEVTLLTQKSHTCHAGPRSVPRMVDLTPSQKGAVAEAAFTAAAIELGLVVLRPLCEGRRYDLVLDLEPGLLRVQCKLAQRLGGVLAVRLKTNRFTPSGYVSTGYSAAEVDAVGIYSAELAQSFLVPIAEISGRRALHLRITPAKNNQLTGVKWARDYALGAMIDRARGDRLEACAAQRQLHSGLTSGL